MLDFNVEKYYKTDFETLNAYGIKFNILTDEQLYKIRNVIITFNETDSVNDDEINLYYNDSVEFLDIDELMIVIKNIIYKDYKETYFEAKNENWEFNYYLSDSDHRNKGTLLIKNELKKHGSVIYSVLAIRKFQNKFYLWDLIE